MAALVVFEKFLDVRWESCNITVCAAALPQLDRGSDYESERHRFESYMPHHLKPEPLRRGFFMSIGRAWIRTCEGASVKRAGRRPARSERARGPAGPRSRGGPRAARGAESYMPHHLKPEPLRRGFFHVGWPCMDSNLRRRPRREAARRAADQRPAGGRAAPGGGEGRAQRRTQRSTLQPADPVVSQAWLSRALVLSTSGGLGARLETRFVPMFSVECRFMSMFQFGISAQIRFPKT